MYIHTIIIQATNCCYLSLSSYTVEMCKIINVKFPFLSLKPFTL